MTKKEIQKRLIRNGEPLVLGDFEWDEKSLTLATSVDQVTIQFDDIHSATINAGDYAVINAGHSTSITAGKESVIVNRNVFEVITLTSKCKSKCNLQICPKDIPGHVIDGVYSVTRKPARIAVGFCQKFSKFFD